MITTEDVTRAAEKAGRNTAKQYPGIEAVDLARQTWDDLIQVVDQLDDRAVLEKAGKRAARQHAKAERHYYVTHSDRFLYTTAQVRALLENTVFVEGVTPPTGHDNLLCSDIEAASIGISVMDVWAGLKRIALRDREVLLRRFGLHEIVNRDAVMRAVDRLTVAMNGT